MINRIRMLGSVRRGIDKRAQSIDGCCPDLWIRLVEETVNFVMGRVTDAAPPSWREIGPSQSEANANPTSELLVIFV